jgi:hypothetical protein
VLRATLADTASGRARNGASPEPKTKGKKLLEKTLVIAQKIWYDSKHGYIFLDQIVDSSITYMTNY